MGFFSPWFLLGLFTLGLPLWLHLLKQHKTVPLPFSSLMFFEKRMQSSVKHRRLRYLLLLALRLLLLLLLALLFAGPYLLLKPSNMVGGRRTVIIAVDNSFSMRQGGQFDKAKQEALRLAGGLGQGTKAQVYSLASHARAMSKFTVDTGQIRGAIDAIQISDERSAYAELGRAVRLATESERTAIEVHFFTDAQQSAMPANFSDIAMPSEASLSVHPTRDAPKANWAVETVVAPGRIFDTKKARVQVTVAGFGTPPASKQVRLFVNGKALESKKVDLAADGRASVEFVSLDATYGFNKCEVRIEPADEFPDDDTFRFAVERADPRRVLLVHADNDLRSALYYRTALEAAGSGNFVLDTVTAGQAVNQSPEKYAFVVLSDSGPLAQSFEEALKRFVNAGGAVFITLGRAAAGMAKIPMIGDAVDGTRTATRAGDRFFSIAWTDATNVVMAKAVALDRVKFFQLVNVKSDGWRPLARTSDGALVIGERQLGEGRILLLASALDNVANDLPLHPTFLPLVEQSARMLARETESATSLMAGAPLELRSARDHASSVEVISPDGKRMLSLEEAAKAQTVNLEREGFYEVRRGQGRQSMVAVNAPRLESNLALVPRETLALWENKSQKQTSATAAAASNFEKPEPWSFWRPLLALLVLAVLAESFIAARHLERDGGDADEDAMGREIA